MQFDIIELTQDELIALSTVQMRLLRSAQRKKDELTAELARDKQTYYNIAVTNGMLGSGVYEDKCGELEAECERRVDIIRDDLIYNMSLNVPTGGRLHSRLFALLSRPIPDRAQLLHGDSRPRRTARRLHGGRDRQSLPRNVLHHAL